MKRLTAFLAVAALAIGGMTVGSPTRVRAQAAIATEFPVVHYHYAEVGGVRIFYREAGPTDAPVVFLPHGFPTSSYMFRRLIPALADRYHVIAPDYPGFGFSDAPDHRTFSYTFAHYATLMDDLLQRLGAKRYAIYLFDYGAPVGLRLAIKHPERVTALIVQNGNAYDDGLNAFWNPMKAYWKVDSPANRAALNFLVTLKTTKFQYLHGVADPSRVDPDTWSHDQPLLERPGNKDLQLDLFHDYGSNVPLYPKFQAFFRESKPPTLIIWGKNDFIFPATGAYPYRRDLPNAEFHLIDSGHFLLEDKADAAFPLIRNFLDRSVAST
jgi:pimeloyl-ACP methyl ester carboxylesterase